MVLLGLFNGSKMAAALPSSATHPRPVLYTHTLCPYAERVLLTLLEKDVAFDAVHIDLSSKPTWYRSINPRGLVPALHVAGKVLLESADICRAVANDFPGEGLTTSSGQRTFNYDPVISAGLSLLGGDNRSWGIGRPTAGDQQRMKAALQQLDDHLGHKGPFVGGVDIGVVDMLLYPFMRRFAVAMPHFSGVDCLVYPHVAAWMEAMGQRPSVQLAAAQDQLLLEAYKQHRCLDFFDYERYGPADLHPQLEPFLQAKAVSS